MAGSQYLRFEEVEVDPAVRKTRIVNVVSVHHGNVLGQIRWYGPWRQYVFNPNAQTVWNPGCLDDVNAKLREMMGERKLARAT